MLALELNQPITRTKNSSTSANTNVLSHQITTAFFKNHNESFSMLFQAIGCVMYFVESDDEIERLIIMRISCWDTEEARKSQGQSFIRPFAPKVFLQINKDSTGARPFDLLTKSCEDENGFLITLETYWS